jgi:hypothetical protein
MRLSMISRSPASSNKLSRPRSAKTRHHYAPLVATEERAMTKPDRTFVIGLALVVAVAIIAAIIKIAWATYVYDDWTCAWSECRRLK